MKRVRKVYFKLSTEKSWDGASILYFNEVKIYWLDDNKDYDGDGWRACKLIYKDKRWIIEDPDSWYYNCSKDIKTQQLMKINTAVLIYMNFPKVQSKINKNLFSDPPKPFSENIWRKELEIIIILDNLIK